MKAIDENVKNIKKNITSIHISYHGECHYNSVRRKDDNDIDGEKPLVINLTIDKSNQSIGEKERNLEKNQLLLEDIVGTACPWKSSSYIKKALELNDSNSDNTIEFIISNPDYLFDELVEINIDLDKIDIDIENNSNIHINNNTIENEDDKKDNKIKINLTTKNKKNKSIKQILSRKELRKLEKNKNNSKNDNKIDNSNNSNESININQIFL